MCLSLDLTNDGWAATPGANVFALFLGVWVIYLFDRLLDLLRTTSVTHLTKRHQWAKDHIRVIVSLGGVALVILLVVILPQLERSILLAGTVAVLITGCYYLLFRLFRMPACLLRFPGKEMTVAVCFAFGITITVTTEPSGGPHFALIGGLVCLFCGNCLLIARAEGELDRRNDRAAHFAHEGVCRRTRSPEFMAGLAMIVSVPVMVSGEFPLTASGMLVCGLLTLLLSGTGKKGEHEFVQMKADGILILPLLIALSKALIFP